MTFMNRLWLAPALLLLATLAMAPSARSEVSIRSLTGIIEGHEVGGLAIDMIGNVYAADFGDVVWKITPEGVRTELTNGLYGTAGNAIDSQGHLLQASFYADTVVRIDRKGRVEPFVTRGLSRPAGIAVHRQTGEAYVANCRGNTISRIDANGNAAVFARGELFNCPYGLAFDRDGNLYAANFQDPRLLKIDANGAVSLLAKVSDQGLGYVCFKNDRLYVTAFRSHAIYEVTLDGKARRLLGNGERKIVDGTATEARLSFPAGIACHPWAPRLYVNEDVNESGAVVPRRSIIRVIELES